MAKLRDTGKLTGRGHLTEAEELLLSSYFDECCTKAERTRAEKLLCGCPGAEEFLKSLKDLRSMTSDTIEQSTPKMSRDLWECVERRIAQEEYSSRFLGERTIGEQKREPSFAERLRSSIFGSALWSGLSGAAVAATVTLFVVADGAKSPGTSGAPGDIASGLAKSDLTSSLAPVSLQRPNILFDQAPSALEVDWMRGNGPTKLIQRPGEGSAIIWVRRRNFRDSRKPVIVENEGAVYPTAATAGSSLSSSNQLR